MRREGSRLRWALVTSAVLHGGVIALLWALARDAAPEPKMRVYAVDIVSPPPQQQGPPDPGGAAPEPAEAEPQADPEPAAATPPAPRPEPPAPAPKKEPAPTPKPKEAAPKEAAKPKEPSAAPKPTKQAEPTKPATKPAEKPAEKPKQASAGTGKPAPATGARPDPSSAGGEGLDMQLKGVQCPSPEYCGNIVRQLYRYFRPPAEAQGDEAEIFFYINRDGSVSDMRVVRSAGSFRFRVAALEAVEQAGLNRAFGPLPKSFSVDRLPVSFYFRPAR